MIRESFEKRPLTGDKAHLCLIPGRRRILPVSRHLPIPPAPP